MPKSIDVIVGTMLREIRKDAGFANTIHATDAIYSETGYHFNQTTVSQYESGIVAPSGLYMVALLSTVYGAKWPLAMARLMEEADRRHYASKAN